MGLMDRDYMRDRARERQRRSGPRVNRHLPVAIIVGLGVGAALLAYNSTMHQEPVRIGPIEVAIAGQATASVQPTPRPEPIDTSSQEGAIVPPSGLTMPEPKTDPDPRPRLEVQTFPESGSVQWIHPPSAGEPLAMLRISDGSGIPGNKVMRLRDAFGNVVAQVYVRDQEGAVVQLPLGRYQLNVMIGEVWHGVHYQFGGGATYHRGSTMIVGHGGGDYMLMPQGTPGLNGMLPIPASSF